MIVSENDQSQVGVREASERKNAKSRESELPPYHPQLLRSWPVIVITMSSRYRVCALRINKQGS